MFQEKLGELGEAHDLSVLSVKLHRAAPVQSYPNLWKLEVNVFI